MLQLRKHDKIVITVTTAKIIRTFKILTSYRFSYFSILIKFVKLIHSLWLVLLSAYLKLAELNLAKANWSAIAFKASRIATILC